MSKKQKPLKTPDLCSLQEKSKCYQISIAPMMDWTNITINYLKKITFLNPVGNMLAHCSNELIK